MFEKDIVSLAMVKFETDIVSLAMVNVRDRHCKSSDGKGQAL